MRDGEAVLITLLDVEPRPERNEHVARVQHLDGLPLAIGTGLVERHPALLHGGLWGSVRPH